MFDFGFWELTIVMVVALLVVGPERLPVLAGQAGRWIGKAKRIIVSIRSDIESEIKAAELKEILQKQQGEIGELKEIIKGTQKELEKEYEQQGEIGELKEIVKGTQKELEKEYHQQGDPELIKAVEEHIESTKQQELSLNSVSNKHEAD